MNEKDKDLRNDIYNKKTTNEESGIFALVWMGIELVADLFSAFL